MNANTTDRTGTPAELAAPSETAGSDKAKSIPVRLVPASNSDQPVLANYTTLHPAPGMLMLDFGFLEPAVLAALPRVAKRGGKMPESLSGRLAVRVALGIDSAFTLHQQLTRMLQGIAQAAEARKGAEGKGSGKAESK